MIKILIKKKKNICYTYDFYFHFLFKPLNEISIYVCMYYNVLNIHSKVNRYNYIFKQNKKKKFSSDM